ncbi:hypothetical protein [Burkholderia sp. PU8-34]
MTQEQNAAYQCSDSEMVNILQTVQNSDLNALRALDAWPADPRLRLLRGATYAGRQDYVHAKADFVAALDLAPDYSVARFMLGFLELTNGEPELALQVWAPLHTLPAGDTLRAFASGLSSLTLDHFDDAILELRQGLASNKQYPLINRYIAAVVEKLDNDFPNAEDSTVLAFAQTVQNPATSSRS